MEELELYSLKTWFKIELMCYMSLPLFDPLALTVPTLEAVSTSSRTEKLYLGCSQECLVRGKDPLGALH